VIDECQDSDEPVGKKLPRTVLEADDGRFSEVGGVRGFAMC
jgi:hypothetical protein